MRRPGEFAYLFLALAEGSIPPRVLTIQHACRRSEAHKTQPASVQRAGADFWMTVARTGGRVLCGLADTVCASVGNTCAAWLPAFSCGGEIDRRAQATCDSTRRSPPPRCPATWFQLAPVTSTAVFTSLPIYSRDAAALGTAGASSVRVGNPNFFESPTTRGAATPDEITAAWDATCPGRW